MIVFVTSSTNVDTILPYRSVFLSLHLVSYFAILVALPMSRNVWMISFAHSALLLSMPSLMKIARLLLVVKIFAVSKTISKTLVLL
jgi:hypothetical protein